MVTDWPLVLMSDETVYIHQENTNTQMMMPGQVPDVMACLSLSHWQCTMPLPLLLYKCILSPCFIFRCLPTPYRPPSRSQASLRNAYAPLASHGFMLWGQNVLTPGPSLFTASLLAGFFFWRRQLQSEKSSHWGGTVYSLGLGGKPLIQSFPICSVFWIGIWMGLEVEGCPYDTLKLSYNFFSF